MPSYRCSVEISTVNSNEVNQPPWSKITNTCFDLWYVIRQLVKLFRVREEISCESLSCVWIFFYKLIYILYVELSCGNVSYFVNKPETCLVFCILLGNGKRCTYSVDTDMAVCTMSIPINQIRLKNFKNYNLFFNLTLT